MEACLGSSAVGPDAYRGLIGELTATQGSQLSECARRLRELVLSLTLPQDLLGALSLARLRPGQYVVRSSSNLEDLTNFSAAGLYDSVVGVSGQQIPGAVARVWASLYSDRAVVARRELGVPPQAASMAVMVQPLVPADISFVMFTRSPLSQRDDRAYAELAVGLAETLTSAKGEGTPLCVEFSKSGEDCQVLAFPSYPRALRVCGTTGPRWETIRYAKVPIVGDRVARRELLRRLATLARTLEEVLGGAQDVEGAVVNGVLHVVQSRPITVPI